MVLNHHQLTPTWENPEARALWRAPTGNRRTSWPTSPGVARPSGGGGTAHLTSLWLRSTADPWWAQLVIAVHWMTPSISSSKRQLGWWDAGTFRFALEGMRDARSRPPNRRINQHQALSNTIMNHFDNDKPSRIISDLHDKPRFQSSIDHHYPLLWSLIINIH